MKRFFQSSDNHSRTIHLIVITLVSFSIFSLIAQFIIRGDFANVAIMKLAQFIQSLGLFIITPILLASLWEVRPMRYLALDRAPALPSLLMVIAVMVVAVPGINLLGELNHNITFPDILKPVESLLLEMEASAAELTEKLLTVSSVWGVLINLFLIAVIPAIGEEMYFRGIVQKMLAEKYASHVAVWITAIIFSIIHFQFFGFLPRVLMGAALGYMFVWSGNLWLPVMAHFTNNGMAVFYYYLKSKGKPVLDLENLGSGDTWYIGVASITLAITILIIIQRYFRKRECL